MSEEQTPAPPFRRTGLFDKDGREICLGDLIKIRNEGPSTKTEYWNPVYEVVWEAPSFKLKYVRGGKHSDPTFHFRNCPSMLETVYIHPFIQKESRLAAQTILEDSNAMAFLIRTLEEDLGSLQNQPQRILNRLFTRLVNS